MYKLFIFSLVSLYANFSFGAVCDTVIVGNGIRYEGQYPCGEGVLYSDSLGIYIGHFERGIPNGVCTHYKKNGHRYYGEFKDGEYSGYGRHFSNSGTIRMGGGDFKDGAANGVDTIYYKPRSIYVGECKDGVPHGNGILYTRIGTISKYYFREGQFENGKLISGFLSNYYGTFPVIGGTTSTGYRKEFSKIDLYSQSELTSKYESLRALKPKKFLGAELTEEQRLFLDEKLSSEQILSIRKSQ